MGMQVLEFEQAVSPLEDAAYRGDSGFFDAIRNTAARSMADTVLRSAAKYRRIEPSENDPFPAVRHVWSIGIERDMGEVEAREMQMEQARREGMAIAAGIVHEIAALYDRGREPADGYCAHVIRFALLDAVVKIRERAA